MNAFAPNAFRLSRNARTTLARGMDRANRAISLTEPLTDDVIRAVAPSVFQAEAHESRSARFKAIPTFEVLNGLRAEGFLPFYAGQSTTRDESKRDFTKHMIRLRHANLANAEGQAFEVVLINGNDGSAAYHMLPGFIRFACENGAIVGETFDEIKVRHTGNAVDQVIEGAYRVIEEAPQLCEQVEEFKTRMLTKDHKVILARAAHVARFGFAEDEEGNVIEGKINDRAPVGPAALLGVRRVDDQGDDLWRTWNRVQENTVRGGLEGRIQGSNGKARKATTRGVNGIGQNVNLNRALWTLQEEMARLMA